jgi:mannosyltransferase OCH1-like enzyme
VQVKWKRPRCVASVESDYVYVVESMLTKKLEAAHATRLRFHQDKELNVTAELDQAAEHNDHELYVVSKIIDARYNEQEMFHELLVAWPGFPVGEATWEPYSVMAVGVPEMVVKLKESQVDTVLMRNCYALLRMRPLSISYAEGFRIISCGKIEYDKFS